MVPTLCALCFAHHAAVLCVCDADAQALVGLPPRLEVLHLCHMRPLLDWGRAGAPGMRLERLQALWLGLCGPEGAPPKALRELVGGAGLS